MDENTKKELAKPLRAEERYQRQHTSGDTVVLVHYTGNQGRLHVSIRRGMHTLYSRTHTDEHVALRDFAERAVRVDLAYQMKLSEDAQRAEELEAAQRADARTFRERVLALAKGAEDAINGAEEMDRQLILEGLIQDLRTAAGVNLQEAMTELEWDILRACQLPGDQPATVESPRTVKVILFKSSGKYYTEEEWRIPTSIRDHSSARGHYTREAIVPADMKHSPDFRRIDGGPVLVETQEPWGYPHLFPGEPS